MVKDTEIFISTIDLFENHPTYFCKLLFDKENQLFVNKRALTYMCSDLVTGTGTLMKGIGLVDQPDILNTPNNVNNCTDKQPLLKLVIIQIIPKIN